MSLFDALGLRPDGDPAAMRAYAGVLRSTADQVQQAGDGAATAVAAATFDGPAGDATRGRAGTLRSRNSAAATRLRDLADRITRAAGEVEHGQAAWDRLRERLEREIREALGSGP